MVFICIIVTQHYDIVSLVSHVVVSEIKTLTQRFDETKSQANDICLYNDQRIWIHEYSSNYQLYTSRQRTLPAQ